MKCSATTGKAFSWENSTTASRAALKKYKFNLRFKFQQKYLAIGCHYNPAVRACPARVTKLPAIASWAEEPPFRTLFCLPCVLHHSVALAAAQAESVVDSAASDHLIGQIQLNK